MTHMNKYLGNPIEEIEPLNAALYYQLGKSEDD